MRNAREEADRMERILDEIDRLEDEMKRIGRIKHVVRRLKERVDTSGDRMERLTSNHSSQAARDRAFDRHSHSHGSRR
jgi:hypothetical protein